MKANLIPGGVVRSAHIYCPGGVEPCIFALPMAGPATISRAQLVYGLCLPLAALIGFFIAEPMRFSSMVVLGVILTVLAWPLFARWHHLLLVGAVNSVFMLSFLPGNLPLWVLVAVGGFFIVIFRRCLDREVILFPPGGVGWSLVALAAAIMVTAYARGGLGLGALGSDTVGGKKYIFLFASIMAYFVVISREVPSSKALLYVGIFCLSGLTNFLSHLIYMAGAGFYWLFAVVDSGPAYTQAALEMDVQGDALFRGGTGMLVGSAVISFLLASHGLRGLLDLRKPWRLLILLGCLAAGTVGGFRSFIVGTGLLLMVLFVVEGLHRTRYMAWVAASAVLGFALLFGFSERLPQSMQRSFSFLPVKVDPRVKQDAQGSIDWRVEMWKAVLQEGPRYALLGKGYGIDPSMLQMSQYNVQLGFGMRAETAVVAGEYHNGPLSVLIPLGAWGGLAFGWFMVASVRRLRWFCQHGDPALRVINRFLLSMFIAKIIFFTVFFGAITSDLIGFVMLIALAECFNTTRSPVMEAGEQETQWSNSSFLLRGGRV